MIGCWRSCAVALMLCGAAGHLWASGPKFVVDLFYEKNADRINGEQLAKLEELRCKVGTRKVEAAIAVGHASIDEQNADRLTLRRAQGVAEWFATQAHWKVFAEGKGARQPVRDNALPSGRIDNRRVETEIVLAGRAGEALSADCTPEWKTQLLASNQTAPTVARVLVGKGYFPAATPFHAALEAKRLDVFDALVAHSGIPLGDEEQAGVAWRALNQGRVDYFIRWAKTRRVAKAERDGEQSLMYRVCVSLASADDKVRAVDALRELGVRVRDPRTMYCAAIWVRQLNLLNAYLRAGGAPYVTPDAVVPSGQYPEMLQRLLAIGVNPASRDSLGGTLFHSIRLMTPSDVQRLLDWGLDINARGKRHTASNPETTPLREALNHSPPEVLDYMKSKGARVEDVRSLDEARINPPAQRWLVENGFSVSPRDIVYLANQDADPIEVYRALKDHGFDLGVQDADGVSALAIAISRFRVELVRLLVESGASLGSMRTWRGGEPRPALVIAEQLSVGLATALCSGCPTSTTVARLSPEYENRKRKIIAIIESALASR